jgi:hypothetical protein
MRVLLVLGTFAVLSCASQQSPPPPAHPVIEGNSESVSHADIRIVLDIVRKWTLQPFERVVVSNANIPVG